MPKLIVRGMVHELVEELITIGRAPENSVQIDDASVSSHHAELRAANKTYRLHDLRSTNGTQVNGKTASEVVLRHGDRIRFGGVQARFEGDVAISSAQALPLAEKVEARAAETSTRPADFANASPFRARSKERDPTRRMVFIAMAVSLLALLAALIAVLTMRAPTL
jgi:pSer/pThr/pTyr-binding forkhead associated (FHA) protein